MNAKSPERKKNAMPYVLRKQMAGILLSLIVIVIGAVLSSGCRKTPSTLEEIFVRTGETLRSGKLRSPDAVGGEWVLLGLEKNALVTDDVKARYLEAASAFVSEKGTNRLNPGKSTENSRVILGVLAAGGDPRSVGGRDLIEGLADLEYIENQGHNGPIWALIALDAGNAWTKEEETSGTLRRETLIRAILDAEKEDGGYSMMNGESDTDLTAMAVQALAPYRDRAEVRACIDRALAHLSGRQKEDGTFEGYGFRSSESVSQVILALASLGIVPENDPRFIKNGITLTDALLGFFSGDGFRHLLTDDSMNDIATEQAYLALTARKAAAEGREFRYLEP